MPGAGTRMDITKDSSGPICLDLTRLISRVGRGPMTGIDRVELAYLRKLSECKVPVFALVNAGSEFHLIDAVGISQLLARFDGRTRWGSRDLLSRVYWRHSNMLQAALSDIRRLRIGRCGAPGLADLLQSRCGAKLRYINVGHSNIRRDVFKAIDLVNGSSILVLLHDTIPLDFPQFQLNETTHAFREKLEVVSAFADAVICPSADCRMKAETHFERLGRTPECKVAHLGITATPAMPSQLPGGLDLSRPYFVTLGTIEPRKNHELLLDVWQRLGDGPEVPTLFVVGQRGWKNESVFWRLDSRPAHVVELNDLSDGGVAALLQKSRGLLFPSLAEGFGLPPAEAALTGVPVFCSDLPVYREFLKDYPVYLNATDSYVWETTIREFTDCRKYGNKNNHLDRLPDRLPTWEDHFNIALNAL